MERNGIASFAGSVSRWGLKSGLGILDQGLYSGANFVTSILLARTMSLEHFGLFALGFSVLSFFMQVYTSFALEPMGIIGPSDYAGRIQPYLLGQVRLLFTLILRISLAMGLILWLAGVRGGHSEGSTVLIISVLALPFILFPLLMRRIFYVLFRPGIALVGSTIYFILLMTIIKIAESFIALNDIAGIVILAIAASMSGVVLLQIFLRSGGSEADTVELKTILIKTWNFGKWLILSGILIGLATQSQVYLTGVLSSVEGAGAVRILQTFIQPMMLTSTAFSALAAPAIAADFAAGLGQQVRRKIVRFTIALASVSLVYAFSLRTFGPTVNTVLLGEKFSAIVPYIPFWGLVPVLLSLYWGGVMALQAARKPGAMLIIAVFWSIFSLVPGVVLIPMIGVWGATISIITGFVAAFSSTWILYWFWVRPKVRDEGKGSG